MKNNHNLKSGIIRTAFLSSALALVIALPSCKNGKTEDSKEVATEHNDAKFDNANEEDAKFLVSAAETNLEEIELGKLAQQNSSLADVKELGKMIEEDHIKALKDLQALASSKQITIPTVLTDNGLDAVKKLKDKTGKDFDKDYCDMMVKGHKDAIDKFEKESTDATDADIRTWATSMVPALRTHLDHAMTCQEKCAKM
ncbi:MAG TPA: DUF4142 domain-containing protein [Cyclobacteriaceae bacterium]|jgi:putative membrane protein|nr:DUF4142 domain-containing protein [Cyclobacteriaceae bacterium]